MALQPTSYDAAYSTVVPGSAAAPAPSSAKLAALKAKIHGARATESSMGDFNPPPAPAVQSADDLHPVLPVAESPARHETVDLAQQAYSSGGAPASQSQVALLTRLDYAIRLLESQHDQKTDTVPEELCLYTFFGVFVIYVLDSFARVARYTR